MTEVPSARSDTFARPKYPYPGLRPFEADEWSIFFGRERMIDDVIERLAARRLVLIHGASGAGKSSLVRAGVLPKLERQHRRAGARWQTCTMRPSGGPLWNLAREFARLEGAADNAGRVGEIVGQFNRRGATLAGIAGSLKNLAGWRLCILVDQFEELFRFEKETSREEADLFVDLLVRSDVEAAQSAGEGADPNRELTAVHVVVTMRSEFLGECARFYGLAEAINRTQYLVPRMDRDALMRAIRRPAQFYGGEVTLALAERLIVDAGGREDELPLIQHGLMLMWHEAVSKPQPSGKIVLDAAPLEAARGLSRMLSAHADAAVQAAAPDPDRRAVVERLFRALTDVNVEGKAIRRPQVFRDLVAVTNSDPETLRAIIDALRSDGVSFLAPYPPQAITDKTPIDISHEALIRCWDRLADPQDGWLKREFEDGLLWRSLLVEAHSFERDRRRVLSPAVTEERSEWWRDRNVNATWADRYGDNFAQVENLLAASRKAAADAKRKSLLAQSVIFTLLIGVIIGLGWVNQSRIAEQWRWYTSDLPFAAENIWPHVLTAEAEQALKPGDTFRECAPAQQNADYCPDMVVVPAGTFMMGSPKGDNKSYTNELPQHEVKIAKPFAVSKFQLTFAEWDTCLTHGGCSGYKPNDFGWGRGQQPVIYVSFDDAHQYTAWLSKMTGKPYRLVTESEYEYATRAGTTTEYPWGDEVGKNNADCNGCGSKWDNDQTAPVGSFSPNKFGLYDMVGNLFEWVEGCYHDNYQGAPTNGSAWIGGDCSWAAVRGGPWYLSPTLLRSAGRSRFPTGVRSNGVGFRIARTLTAP